MAVVGGGPEVSTPRAGAPLACPRCGGTPDPEGGPGLLARCGSCGLLGRISGEHARGRVVAPVRTTSDDALARIAHALEERGRGRGPEIAIDRRELVYVPYWRVETVLVGRIEGERSVVIEEIKQAFDDQGARRPIVRRREDGVERVVKEVQEVHVAIVSACPLEEFGLPALDSRRQMPGELGVRRRADLLGPLTVFDPSLRDGATVLDPILGRERAIEEADLIVGRRVEGLRAGLLPGASVEVERIGRAASLLFYPVWLAWFGAGGRSGQAAVDGSTGALVSLRTGRLPAAAMHRRALGVAALGAGLVVGGLLRASIFPPPLLAELEAKLTLAVLAGLLGGASHRILSLAVRHLSEEQG